MMLKQALLAFIGFGFGAVIAAGVFAFITVLGLIPRLAARTRTAHRIHLYEDCIVVGGFLGNLLDLFRPRLFGGPAAGAALGLLGGIFVGCLVMSLAETLDALPVMVRRTRLAVGFPYVVAAIALGKCAGSLLYFWWG